jgi:hypothetical protein
MKRLLTIFLTACLFFAYNNTVLAANTYSLDFESGSSQHAYAADSASLSITGDMTIEFWVKPESLPDTQYRIVDKTNDASNQDAYSILVSSNGKLNLTISSSDGAYTDGIFWNSTNALFSTGAWAHFAIVVDVSASSVTVYKNGTAVAGTSSGTGTSIFNGTAKLSIGCQAWDNPIRFYDGLIDEVRIWNDIRTEAEIQANMNVELVGNEAGLVAYYKLNNSALDETANNNDLTLVNSPTYSTDVPFVGASPAVIPKRVDILNFE